MLKLKSREKSIPNGLQFYISQLPNFKLPPQCSFAVAVDSIVAVRKANPYLAHKLGWKTDQVSVENELDFFNASICAAQNWTSYIATEGQGAPPIPKPLAAQHKASGAIAAAANTARKLWAGFRTANDFIDSGAPAVPQEQSNARAGVCAGCAHNKLGDWTNWFTGPASEVIKRQAEKLSHRKLRTDFDDKIKVCEICICPLAAKVHTPMEFIKAHMMPEVLADLRKVQNCWIPKELDGK